MKVKVLQRQTLSDIALQVYGDISGIVGLAMSNGVGVADQLVPGTVLECPDVIYDNYLQNYVRVNHIVPATAYDGLGELTQRIFTDQFTEEFD